MKIGKIHDLKDPVIEDRPGISTRCKLSIAAVVLILAVAITTPLAYQAVVVHRIRALIAALSSKDPAVAANAAQRLSTYNSKWTIRLLIAAYAEAKGDPSPRREGISKALAMIGEPAVADALAAVRFPEQYAGSDRIDARTMLEVWPNIRYGCIDAAEKMGPRGKPILQAALTSGDLDAEKRAVGALVRMKDPSLVPTLLQNRHAYAWGTEELADLIAGAGPSVIGQLTAALQSSDANMSVPAAQILGRLPGTASVDALVEALAQNDPGLRMAVAEALGAIGEARAATAVIKLLDDESVGVKSAAAGALGRIGGDAAKQALLARLGAADQSLRWEMAVALERIGGDDARAAVDSVLSGDDLKAIASGYAFPAAGIDARLLSIPEPVLIIALERYGTLDMAACLARSPSTVLQDAARSWAKRRGRPKDLEALVPSDLSRYRMNAYGQYPGVLPAPARPSQTPATAIESTGRE